MDDHFSLVREVRAVLNLVVAALRSSEPSEGEWNRIRVTLFRALRPFDDARRAVREALTELGQMGELAPS